MLFMLIDLHKCMGLFMQRLCLEVESEDNSFISNSIEISPRILSMGGFQGKKGVQHKDVPTDFS